MTVMSNAPFSHLGIWFWLRIRIQWVESDNICKKTLWDLECKKYAWHWLTVVYFHCGIYNLVLGECVHHPTTNSRWRQYWFETFFIMVFFFCMQWANENWIYELNSNVKWLLTELQKHQRCFDRNRHCALSSSLWWLKLVPAWCKMVTSSRIIIFFTLVSDLISCIFTLFRDISLRWFVMDNLQVPFACTVLWDSTVSKQAILKTAKAYIHAFITSCKFLLSMVFLFEAKLE